jgi:periodic tryptophan protein 2
MLRHDAPEGGEEDDDNMQWRIADRHYFHQNNAHVTCAGFHPDSKLLVTGFSNGIFMIHELPDFSQIQNLK